MSVHYLIDGYNAIHQIPKLASQKSLRDARDALVGILATGIFSGSARNRLTVIFDGQPDVWHASSPSWVKVAFASHQTADDLIRTTVEKSDAKKTLYVITDDKALAQSVRALGARTISVKDFFATILQKKKAPLKSKGAADASEEKHVSATAAYKINDELKNIWLK